MLFSSTQKLLLLLCLIVSGNTLFAQSLTQLIEGRVIDKETLQPLGGAIIYVEDVEQSISTVSDVDGYFILNNIPVGRQTLKAQKQDYQTYFTDNLLVLASKESYVEIQLTRDAQNRRQAFAVTDHRENLPINDDLVLSSRSFSAEETERYAGAIDDPQRMALTFPGIQSFRDSENDVIMRGRLSNRMAWYIEGMDVKSPNQFFRTGRGSGAISILNSSLLSYSDVSTGAFPAEYGNTSAGLFDLKFRKGNLKKHNFSMWASLLSLGATASGPIKTDRSSYLVNFRYSTLGVLDAAGINLVRENADFTFLDFNFNLRFYSQDRRHQTSIFGILGAGTGFWSIKSDTSEWASRLDYTQIDYRPRLAIFGINHSYSINSNSYLQFIAGTDSRQFLDNQNNALLNNQRVLTNGFTNIDINLAVNYVNKVSDRVRIKTGLLTKVMQYNLAYEEYDFASDTLNVYLNESGITFLPQLFTQSTFKISNRFKANAGLRFMLFTLNTNLTIEPRVSLSYQITPRLRISGAYGIYGTIMPLGTYLLRIPNASGLGFSQPNLNRSTPITHQAVLGLRQNIGNDFSIHLEGYYYRTPNSPISTDSLHSFFLFNYRDVYGNVDFSDNALEENYGIELTFEKSFRKGYFILASGTYYRSVYTTPSGEQRSGSTDNRYIASIAAGKEFYFGKGNILQLGLRGMGKGGVRYTPVDELASAAAGRLVLDTDAIPFSREAAPYLRLDTRIAYRKVAPTISWMIEVSIQNTTNYNNLLEFEWNRITNQLEERYNSGITPVARFQVDF